MQRSKANPVFRGLTSPCLCLGRSLQCLPRPRCLLLRGHRPACGRTVPARRATQYREGRIGWLPGGCATASSRDGGWKPKSWCCGISSMCSGSAHHVGCICVGPIAPCSSGSIVVSLAFLMPQPSFDLRRWYVGIECVFPPIGDGSRGRLGADRGLGPFDGFAIMQIGNFSQRRPKQR